MAFDIGNIGSKSDLLKAQVKHMVPPSDVAAIAKAVEAVARLSNGRISDYVAPLGALRKAIKAFKDKNAKKHPKFIKVLDDEFDKPAADVETDCLETVKLFSNAPKALRDSAEFWKKVAQILQAAPLDAAKTKEALAALTTAGTSYNQGLAICNKVASSYGVTPLKEIYDTGNGKLQLYKDIDKALNLAVKNNNFSVNVAPMIANLKELYELSRTLAERIVKTA